MEQQKKIYVFGNEHLAQDKAARLLGEKLAHSYDVVNCRSPDELLEVEDDLIIILDVVKNISEPIHIKNMDQLQNYKSMASAHDVDVGFIITLMKEMGINKTIEIIGIPASGIAEEQLPTIEGWL